MSELTGFDHFRAQNYAKYYFSNDASKEQVIKESYRDYTKDFAALIVEYFQNFVNGVV